MRGSQLFLRIIKKTSLDRSVEKLSSSVIQKELRILPKLFYFTKAIWITKSWKKRNKIVFILVIFFSPLNVIKISLRLQESHKHQHHKLILIHKFILRKLKIKFFMMSKISSCFMVTFIISMNMNKIYKFIILILKSYFHQDSILNFHVSSLTVLE